MPRMTSSASCFLKMLVSHLSVKSSTVVRALEYRLNAGNRPCFLLYFNISSKALSNVSSPRHIAIKRRQRLFVGFPKPSLSASLSPDGKAKDWPVYDLKDRKVMVLDEFNIHPEKEADRKIVDWDRTYFLLKNYMLLPVQTDK